MVDIAKLNKRDFRIGSDLFDRKQDIIIIPIVADGELQIPIDSPHLCRMNIGRLQIGSSSQIGKPVPVMNGM